MGVEEYPQRFFPQGFPQKGAVEKERMRNRKKGTYKDVKVCKRHVYMYETGFCNGDMCFIWGRHKLLAAQFRAGKFTRGNCIRLLKISSHSKGTVKLHAALARDFYLAFFRRRRGTACRQAGGGR